MTPYYADPLVTLYLGDCLEAMRELPDASIDAVVTDPPYGLEFMGKEWNRLGSGRRANPFDPQKQHMNRDPWEKMGAVRPSSFAPKRMPKCGRCGKWQYNGSPTAQCSCADPEWITDTWTYPQRNQQWHEAWAREAFRVAKPGAHLLAFGGTRTYHRLAAAIEDAGWEIRDCLVYAYAQGFPKSLNLDRSEAFCRCERAVDLPPQHDLRNVRERDVPHAQEVAGGEGSVLFPSLSESDVPATAIQSQEGQLGTAQRVMEGRRDVLQDARQLRRGQVRAGTGVGASDGEDGRVHHGAPPAGSAAPRSAAEPDGGGQPSRSQPSEQRAGELGALAYERGPQAGGVWPLCDRCGKPQIPRGLGTALKPAWEPIVMARKPLIGSVAQNVMRYGTGALNIDGTRIPSGEEPWDRGTRRTALGQMNDDGWEPTPMKADGSPQGRWPPNLLLSDPIFDGDTPGVVGGGETNSGGETRGDFEARSGFGGGRITADYPDSGTYSRFFLVPKADRNERERGLNGAPKQAAGTMQDDAYRWEVDGKGNRINLNTQRANHHPTVKPIDLMRHLVRLVVPPGGTCLDPFLGSGTTALACSEEGFRCIGIEKEPEYLEIAKGRLMATPMGLGLEHGIATQRKPSTSHWPARRTPHKSAGWGFTSGQEGLAERYEKPPEDVPA